MLGMNGENPENLQSSYKQDFLPKENPYDPDQMKENQTKMEKVSIYMGNPEVPFPQKNTNRFGMNSVFNHQMNNRGNQEPSKRVQTSDMQLGFYQSDPVEFYKTSNKRYFTQKGRSALESKLGEKTSFKDKNSKDHLVFGESSNDYLTETKKHFKNYHITEADLQEQMKCKKASGCKDMLNFNLRNKYESSYGATFNNQDQTDSLNQFISNHDQMSRKMKENQRKSTVLPYKNQEKMMSVYNSTFQGKEIETPIDPKEFEYQKRSKGFRNIIAFDDSNQLMSNNSNQIGHLRKQTPFGTSYNADYIMRERMKVPKKFHKNLQSTNFRLGEHTMSYLTNNKENFKKHQDPKVNLMYAGKFSNQQTDHLKGNLGNVNSTGVSNYEVFINQRGNKINLI